MISTTEVAINATISDCPDFTEDTRALLKSVTFWMEGVLCCLIAIPGFIGNIGSSFVLSTKEMRNSFNLLLIALACFDNVYLFGGILESIRKEFGLQTRTHIMLFPYFLYPLHTIAMTGSIFLTVAIALERFFAVHYPLNYSQTSNDSKALKIRLLKYLCPVTILSLLFNVTKFFEATYEYESPDDEMPILKPTDLRTDATYSIYFNWFRFITVGVIPFGLLAFFNARIYRALQQRRKRAEFRSIANSEQTNRVTAVSRFVNDSPVAAASLERLPKSDSITPTKAKQLVEVIDENGSRIAKTNENLGTVDHGVEEIQEADIEKASEDVLEAFKGSEPSAEEEHKISFELQIDPPTSMSEADKEKEADEVKANLSAKTNNSSHVENEAEEEPDKKEMVTYLVVGKDSKLKGFYNSSIRRYRERTEPSFPSTNRSQPNRELVRANARRRSLEDHLASIFMSYILVFLICHSPRLILNIYELVTIRHALLCQQFGKSPFPAWSHILTNFSHLLLTVNSSINILIYCCLSSKFRAEVARIASQFWPK